MSPAGSGTSGPGTRACRAAEAGAADAADPTQPAAARPAPVAAAPPISVRLLTAIALLRKPLPVDRATHFRRQVDTGLTHSDRRAVDSRTFDGAVAELTDLDALAG
jgi:hypothetical protein